MRFSLKKIFASLVVVYAIFGFILLPYILKPKLIEIVSQELNAKLDIKSLYINPFLFKLHINGVLLSDLENKEIASFESLFLDFELYSLFRGAIHIDEIAFIEPKFNLVKHSDNSLNIFALLKEKENSNAEDTNSSKALSLPRIILDEFTMSGGNFLYRDETLREPFLFHFHDIKMSVTAVDTHNTNQEAALFELYTGLDDGGFIDIKSELYKLEDPEISGSFELEASRLFNKWKYIRDMVNFEVADGKFSMAGEYFFSQSDLNATHLKNVSLALDRLRLKPKERAGDLVNIESLSVQNATLYPFTKSVEIEKIALDGSKLLFKRDKDGVLDWSRYLSLMGQEGKKEDEVPLNSDENNITTQWSARLNALELKGISVAFEDSLSMPQLNATLQEIALTSGVIEFKEQREGADVAFADANLSLKEFAIKESLEASELVKFKEFSLNQMAFSTQKHLFNIAQTTLDTLEVQLQKEQDGKFRLEKIIESQKDVATKERTQKDAKTHATKSEQPYELRLEEFLLKDSLLAFEDKSLQKSMKNELKNINARVLDITTKSEEALKYELVLELLSGGDLHASGELSHSPLKESGSFVLSDIALGGLNPYVEESTHLTLKDGRISLDGKTELRQKRESFDFEVGGAFVTESLVVEDMRDVTELFSIKKLQTKRYDFKLEPMELLVGEVDIYSLFLGLSIDANATLNLSQILKTQKQESQEKEQKVSESKEKNFAYRVEKLNLHKWQTLFDDNSKSPTVKADIHDIEGSLYPISSDPKERSHVDIKGVINEFASLRLYGEIESADPTHFTDLHLLMKNINLNALSGYSAAFTGYEIDEGSLNLDLGYDIQEGMLLGKNGVVVEKIKLGETRKEEGVNILPMGLAIALLRDKEGAVNLQLPVKGDVNSPDFKYGGLLLQTFTNLMSRAVTSPFRFLSDAMGLNSEDIEYIAFEAGRSDIAPPERQKIADIAKILEAKPDIRVVIAGSYELLKDKEALQMQKLIEIVVQESGIQSAREYKKAMSIELLEKIFLMSSSREQLEKLHKTGNEEEYKQELINQCRKIQIVEDDELIALADKRARKLYTYMTDVVVIESSRVLQTESQEREKNSQPYVKLPLEIELK